MIDMSSCLKCKSPILGDAKIHLGRCEQAERVRDALQYCDEQGIESLTLEQVSNLTDYLINTPLSGDLMARLVLNELSLF